MYRDDILAGMSFVSHQKGENDCNWATDCRLCKYMEECPMLKEVYDEREIIINKERFGR